MFCDGVRLWRLWFVVVMIVVVVVVIVVAAALWQLPLFY
jgi:hypothetical protein